MGGCALKSEGETRHGEPAEEEAGGKGPTLSSHHEHTHTLPGQELLPGGMRGQGKAHGVSFLSPLPEDRTRRYRSGWPPALRILPT